MFGASTQGRALARGGGAAAGVGVEEIQHHVLLTLHRGAVPTMPLLSVDVELDVRVHGDQLLQTVHIDHPVVPRETDQRWQMGAQQHFQVATPGTVAQPLTSRIRIRAALVFEVNVRHSRIDIPLRDDVSLVKVADGAISTQCDDAAPQPTRPA